MSEEKVLREILSRKDPYGYYVIPADRKAVEELKHRYGSSLFVEETSDVVFVRVSSRSLAEKIARFLLNKGMLRTTR